MELTVTAISSALGAEITGADLSQDNDASFAAIKRALLDHHMIVVRDQDVPPASHIAFSRRFGPVEAHDNTRYLKEGFPEILVLSNDLEDGEPIGVPDAGDAWHSDLSFKEIPALVTILFAVRLPNQGGDTDFANCHAAYDALDDAMKNRLEGLQGVHTVNKLRNPRVTIAGTRRDAEEFYRARDVTVTHPLVRTHPETGRKSLYLSPRFTIAIKGMDDSEAQPLLDELIAHQLDMKFRYRHKWQSGDFVMWDNRSVNHQACGGYDYPDIRTIHRTTVLGDAPY
jgi:taurine dioxygenase